MAIRDTRDVSGSYSEKLAALIETETQMGERAALLADLADALSHFPETVEVGRDHITFSDRKLNAADWLSLRDLALMVHTWREQRASVDAMWNAMSWTSAQAWKRRRLRAVLIRRGLGFEVGQSAVGSRQ